MENLKINLERDQTTQELLEIRNELEKQINEIDKKLESLKSKDSDGKFNEAKLESNEVKFFGMRNGQVLERELSNSSDALFKVFNIKGDEAEFEYCGGVINTDFFDNVARFKNNPYQFQNRTKIITVKPGVVRKDSNNKWVVEKKAEIEFFGN